MAENLSIKNFGPIKDVLIDLKNTLILIGPQASGKSAIAKLITICRDFSFVVNNEAIEGLLSKYNIQSFLLQDTFIEYRCDSYIYTYQNRNGNLKINENHRLQSLLKEYKELKRNAPEGDIDEHFNYIQKQKSEVEDMIKSIEKQTSEESANNILQQAKLKLADLSANLELYSKRINNKKDVLNEILHFTNYSQYIPAERLLIPLITGSLINLINNKVPLPQNLLDFGSEYEKAKNKLKTLKIGFINVEYKYINDEDRVYLDSKKYIKLAESSSGFQAVIPLVLVVESLFPIEGSGHTFVVEEPELNLYPETQKELIKYLVQKCCLSDSKSNYYNELIITTHSPYILTSLNNLLLAFKVGSKNLEAEKIVDKNSWIDPKKFNAYLISDGGAKKIFNEDTGLIDDDTLDSTSESILYEFDHLMELL